MPFTISFNLFAKINAKNGIDFIFIHSNSVKLKMDDVHLTSVFMKFEKEGQSYKIPLTGHKVILQPNTSTIAFRARDQTLSVTTRSTQIELYFEQTKEDHEVKKFNRSSIIEVPQFLAQELFRSKLYIVKLGAVDCLG